MIPAGSYRTLRTWILEGVFVPSSGGKFEHFPLQACVIIYEVGGISYRYVADYTRQFSTRVDAVKYGQAPYASHVLWILLGGLWTFPSLAGAVFFFFKFMVQVPIYDSFKSHALCCSALKLVCFLTKISNHWYLGLIILAINYQLLHRLSKTYSHLILIELFWNAATFSFIE